MSHARIYAGDPSVPIAKPIQTDFAWATLDDLWRLAAPYRVQLAKVGKMRRWIERYPDANEVWQWMDQIEEQIKRTLDAGAADAVASRPLRGELGASWDALPERRKHEIEQLNGWPGGRNGAEVAATCWAMVTAEEPVWPKGECPF